MNDQYPINSMKKILVLNQVGTSLVLPCDAKTVYFIGSSAATINLNKPIVDGTQEYVISAGVETSAILKINRNSSAWTTLTAGQTAHSCYANGDWKILFRA